MCQVKSMILLKDSVYCPDNTDSHNDMVEKLGIKDESLKPDFVKVEITPPNKDFFKPLSKWNFRVDQDYTPDWYVAEFDKERALKALKEWADGHIFIDKDNFQLKGDGYFYLKNCKNVEASGNATVEASDNATVEAWDNATVEASDNATVKAWGNATVKASDNATVKASGNATVEAWGNATVEASGNATVEASDNATVEASGNATGIIKEGSYSNKDKFVLMDNSTLKDCNVKTIYQAGDWKFVKVE